MTYPKIHPDYNNLELGILFRQASYLNIDFKSNNTNFYKRHLFAITTTICSCLIIKYKMKLKPKTATLQKSLNQEYETYA